MPSRIPGPDAVGRVELRRTLRDPGLTLPDLGPDLLSSSIEGLAQSVRTFALRRSRTSTSPQDVEPADAAPKAGSSSTAAPPHAPTMGPVDFVRGDLRTALETSAVADLGREARRTVDAAHAAGEPAGPAVGRLTEDFVTRTLARAESLMPGLGEEIRPQLDDVAGRLIDRVDIEDDGLIERQRLKAFEDKHDALVALVEDEPAMLGEALLRAGANLEVLRPALGGRQAAEAVADEARQGLVAAQARGIARLDPDEALRRVEAGAFPLDGAHEQEVRAFIADRQEDRRLAVDAETDRALAEREKEERAARVQAALEAGGLPPDPTTPDGRRDIDAWFQVHRQGRVDELLARGDRELAQRLAFEAVVELGAIPTAVLAGLNRALAADPATPEGAQQRIQALRLIDRIDKAAPAALRSAIQGAGGPEALRLAPDAIGRARELAALIDGGVPPAIALQAATASPDAADATPGASPDAFAGVAERAGAPAPDDTVSDGAGPAPAPSVVQSAGAETLDRLIGRGQARIGPEFADGQALFADAVAALELEDREQREIALSDVRARLNASFPLDDGRSLQAQKLALEFEAALDEAAAAPAERGALFARRFVGDSALADESRGATELDPPVAATVERMRGTGDPVPSFLVLRDPETGAEVFRLDTSAINGTTRAAGDDVDLTAVLLEVARTFAAVAAGDEDPEAARLRLREAIVEVTRERGGFGAAGQTPALQVRQFLLNGIDRNIGAIGEKGLEAALNDAFGTLTTDELEALSDGLVLLADFTPLGVGIAAVRTFAAAVEGIAALAEGDDDRAAAAFGESGLELLGVLPGGTLLRPIVEAGGGILRPLSGAARGRRRPAPPAEDGGPSLDNPGIIARGVRGIEGLIGLRAPTRNFPPDVRATIDDLDRRLDAIKKRIDAAEPGSPALKALQKQRSGVQIRKNRIVGKAFEVQIQEQLTRLGIRAHLDDVRFTAEIDGAQRTTIFDLRLEFPDGEVAWLEIKSGKAVGSQQQQTLRRIAAGEGDRRVLFLREGEPIEEVLPDGAGLGQT